MMIQTVQVGVMTVSVPPGSFRQLSTVQAIVVIILIFGTKGVTTMRRERVPCCPCNITRDPQSKLFNIREEANNQRENFFQEELIKLTLLKKH